MHRSLTCIALFACLTSSHATRADDGDVVFYLDEHYEPQTRLDRVSPLSEPVRAILAMYALQAGGGCSGTDPDDSQTVSCVLTKSLGVAPQCSARHLELVRHWFSGLPRISGYGDRFYEDIRAPGQLETICYKTYDSASFQEIWEIIRIRTDGDTVRVNSILSWLARGIRRRRDALDSVFRVGPDAITVISHDKKRLETVSEDPSLSCEPE